MKVLFMDDDPNRHAQFNRWLNYPGPGIQVKETSIAWDGEAGKKALETEVFDMVYLDHDMGPNAYARAHDPTVAKDPNEIDGTDVANFIASLPPERRPKEANCHSLIRENRVRMARILKAAGVRVNIFPFQQFFQTVTSRTA